MTREDALERLRAAQTNEDREHAHQDADDVLCDLLETLGFADVVAEYDKIKKWYV